MRRTEGQGPGHVAEHGGTQFACARRHSHLLSRDWSRSCVEGRERLLPARVPWTEYYCPASCEGSGVAHGEPDAEHGGGWSFTRRLASGHFHRLHAVHAYRERGHERKANAENPSEQTARLGRAHLTGVLSFTHQSLLLSRRPKSRSTTEPIPNLYFDIFEARSGSSARPWENERMPKTVGNNS